MVELHLLAEKKKLNFRKIRLQSPCSIVSYMDVQVTVKFGSRTILLISREN